MILEARSAGCCTWAFVLTIDGRPHGRFEGQFFSENLSIDLTERRHFEFRKTSWMGSQFELVDLAHEEVVAWCDRSGLFTSSWDLSLSVGAGQLVHTGWFQTSYDFMLGDESLARVDRLGVCEWGWNVDGAGVLKDEDLLMIGLVYHTILSRRQRSQNQAGGAAGGT